MMKCRSHRNHKTPAPGFTLVEVLAVIMLIGLLAVFIVPQILQRVNPAKQSVARAQIANLEQILALFEQDCGRYPDQSEGLQALVQVPPALAKWKGPYCKDKQLTDPWGNGYQYQRPGTRNVEYDIYSLGADGQAGGDGMAADIYND